ncbi:MAG: hypothetical protein PHN69_04940 [Candidatus Pacebacteria bacterium]|nr:hypothetical protein [Candidatus Paceibacterota bacterium]
MDKKEFTLIGGAILAIFVILMTLGTFSHMRTMTCIKAGYTQELVPSQYTTIWVRE